MEERRFRLQYRHLIEEVNDRYPGFWAELHDLAESRERRRTTTRGAIVREFPRTRDEGTQTGEGRTLGQRLFGVFGPACRHADTQTEPLLTRSTGVQAEDSPPDSCRVAAEGPRPLGRGRGRLALTPALRRPGQMAETTPPPRPPPPRPDNQGEARAVVPVRPPTRGSSICWNCRSTDHRYSTCPLPKDRQYCYGCGRENETLRTCPRCREDWRDLGPYHPDRGHLGKRSLP